MNQTGGASAIHFIVNPWAGKRTAPVEDAILRYAEANNLRWQIDVAREKYSLKQTTQKAIEAGAICVVSVGGDGTLNDVSGVVMGSGVPLGILPCGTGNDFIKSVGIPTDLTRALDVIRAQHRRAVDMGSVNGVPFINIAGAGFDADVDIYIKRYKGMGLSGLPAYLAATLQAVAAYDTHEARVEFRGVEAIPGTVEQPFLTGLKCEGDALVGDLRMLLIAACNGRHFGGGMPIAPQAIVDDGRFDVCVVHALNRRTILKMLPGLLKGKHVEKSEVCAYFRANEIRLRFDRPVNTELDGEVSQWKDLHILLHPKAIDVIVPHAIEE